jgi:hypothetical protein
MLSKEKVRALIGRLRTLSKESLKEVELFVEFLQAKEGVETDTALADRIREELSTLDERGRSHLEAEMRDAG